MSLPERVGSDPCRLEERWGLSPRLADMLVQMERFAKEAFAVPGRSFWPGLRIISGHRSLEQNLAAGGVSDSLHLLCPSLAADLRVGAVEGVESGNVWAILGGWWKLRGGTWGGDFQWRGSPLPNPMEWNHFAVG